MVHKTVATTTEARKRNVVILIFMPVSHQEAENAMMLYSETRVLSTAVHFTRLLAEMIRGDNTTPNFSQMKITSVSTQNSVPSENSQYTTKVDKTHLHVTFCDIEWGDTGVSETAGERTTKHALGVVARVVRHRAEVP